MAKRVSKLVPPTKLEQKDLPPEELEKLVGTLKRFIDSGWTDQEIAYDLGRTNGTTIKETGKIYGNCDLVAVIRTLYKGTT